MGLQPTRGSRDLSALQGVVVRSPTPRTTQTLYLRLPPVPPSASNPNSARMHVLALVKRLISSGLIGPSTWPWRTVLAGTTALPRAMSQTALVNGGWYTQSRQGEGPDRLGDVRPSADAFEVRDFR